MPADPEYLDTAELGERVLADLIASAVYGPIPGEDYLEAVEARRREYREIENAGRYAPRFFEVSYLTTIVRRSIIEVPHWIEDPEGAASDVLSDLAERDGFFPVADGWEYADTDDDREVRELSEDDIPFPDYRVTDQRYTVAEIDTESSASRQHHIDTGRYLVKGVS